MISGEELAAARDRAGLSQEALAKLLGVDLKTVNNWENGRSKPRAHRQKVGDFIAAHPPAEEPVLRSITDRELLNEVARRMARPIQEEGNDGGTSTEKSDNDVEVSHGEGTDLEVDNAAPMPPPTQGTDSLP